MVLHFITTVATTATAAPTLLLLLIHCAGSGRPDDETQQSIWN